MRRKTWLSILGACAGIILSVSLASAVGMHDFDCKECHTSSLSVDGVGNNVCLNCHSGMGAPVNTFGPNSSSRQGNAPSYTFSAGDASNLYNSASLKGMLPVSETSHFWGGTSLKPRSRRVSSLRPSSPQSGAAG